MKTDKPQHGCGHRRNTAAPHNPKKKRSALAKAQRRLDYRIKSHKGGDRNRMPTEPGSLKVRR